MYAPGDRRFVTSAARAELARVHGRVVGTACAELARVHAAADVAPPAKRYALVVCFLVEAHKTILDHVVEMHRVYMIS
ncbi:MAG TPA: hypothetical protein VF516_27185 [Kofleriaceae bacterium]